EARRARSHPPARPLQRTLRRSLSQGPHRVLPPPRRRQGRVGQHRSLRLARLSDADEDRLSLPRLDPGRADRARPRAAARLRRAPRRALRPPARLDRRAPALSEGLAHRPLGGAAACTNARSFAASSAPFVLTPLQMSSANGCTASMASRTLSARKPPARKSGTP